jgi:hypothetical protein
MPIDGDGLGSAARKSVLKSVPRESSQSDIPKVTKLTAGS